MINIIMLMVVTVSSNQGTTIVPGPTPWLPQSQIQTVPVNVPVSNSDIVPYFSSTVRSHFAPETYGSAGKISFANGIAFNTRVLGKTGEPDLPGNLVYQDREQALYYIVQFTSPVYGSQRSWLESKGVNIHFYVPDYGFVCRIDDPATLNDIAANPAVGWVGIYQPAYKVSALFDQVGEEHMTVILLFQDADIQAVTNEVKALTGRTELEVIDNGVNKIIRGVMNKSMISGLARIPGVYWVGPYLQTKYHNVDVQWIVQSGTSGVRGIWAMGIAGEGEITSSLDSGINTAHLMHRSGSAQITTWGLYTTHNAIVAYDSGASANILFGDNSNYHGTHTTGTITGDDTLTGSTIGYDGVAKRSRHYFLDGGSNDATAIYTMGDLNDDYIRPYNRYYVSNGIRAYVSSNSWGSDASGAYTEQSLQVDQFMWGHRDFCLFYSNGNAMAAGSVGSPASAKNCVSVGGVLNGASYTSYYTTTSRGPTADGRYKPTILTPANTVYSSYSGTNTIAGMQGTSMASPSACGAGALVRQYLREGWYPYGKKVAGASWGYISAAMVKAILINCADPNVGAYNVPDNNIGWGRVDLDSTLYFSGRARKTLLVDDTIGILTGEQVDYHFNMPSGAANLKIALVWTDYPGSPSITKQIVNDLDLTAYFGANYYRGNQYTTGHSTLNPAGRDSINVEECVHINAPTTGDCRVVIQGRNVPVGPQPFALVITYNATTIAGVIKLNKAVYRCNDYGVVDTVRIRVEDNNYGTAGVRDSFRIPLYAKLTEPQPESVWVKELAESAYVFTGQIPLLFNKAAHADGRISVCQGDTVFASYTDLAPAYTSTTWSTVDAYYFLISYCRAENIGSNLADVCWNTNENASSKVYYGTSPSNLNLNAGVDTPYVLPHRVRLTGLTSRTTYYYDVESKDFRGNLVRDNNGGLHYSFTSQSVAGIDILVALCDGYDKTTPTGQALPGLAYRFQKAINTGGWSYNWWATSDNGGDLPPRSVMRNYKAIFVPNEDEYPEFLPRQMDTIRYYEEGGGRIAFSSHDLLWYSWDPAGGNPQVGLDSMWCKNYMHARYKGDITTTGTINIYGVAADPVTGNYTTGVSYSPHRTGADGDTIVNIDTPPNGWDAGGTSAYIWKWNAAAGNNVGNRWESGANHGSAGQGVWGGYHTRTILNAFSCTQMDTTKLPNILNDQFIWLIGHDHPDVALTVPVTGGTYTSSPINVTWTSTFYGGAVVDTTWVEYSPDAGQTWITIAAGPAITSPYAWNLSAIQNATTYRLRVIVADKNIYPSLKGMAQTGNFTINIAGNDDLGPKVLPNSIVVTTNPKIVTAVDTSMLFTAWASDSLTGLSNIAAAEWRIINSASGVSPMTAVDGSFNAIIEQVRGTIRFQYNPGATSVCSLQVRGQDNAALKDAANWGAWYTRTFTLIDGTVRPVGVDEYDGIPTAYALFGAKPNPFLKQINIGFAIPSTDKVSLKVYNSLGQLVRTLVNDVKQPGYYSVTWDGRDDVGRTLAAGIYFYQITTQTYTDTKKAILVK